MAVDALLVTLFAADAADQGRQPLEQSGRRPQRQVGDQDRLDAVLAGEAHQRFEVALDAPARFRGPAARRADHVVVDAPDDDRPRVQAEDVALEALEVLMRLVAGDAAVHDWAAGHLRELPRRKIRRPEQDNRTSVLSPGPVDVPQTQTCHSPPPLAQAHAARHVGRADRCTAGHYEPATHRCAQRQICKPLANSRTGRCPVELVEQLATGDAFCVVRCQPALVQHRATGAVP